MADFMKYLAKHYYLECSDLHRANKALVYRIVKNYGTIDIDTLNRICLKIVPKRYFINGMFYPKELVDCLEQEGFMHTNAYGVVEFIIKAA